ncbi:hypothetical protein SprV_0200641300 [Sparganum proliferum]
MRGCPQVTSLDGHIARRSSGKSLNSTSMRASGEPSHANVDVSPNGRLAPSAGSMENIYTGIAPSSVSAPDQPRAEALKLGLSNDTVKVIRDFTRSFLISFSLTIIILTPVTLLVFFLVTTFTQTNTSPLHVGKPRSTNDEPSAF